jgi:hypothetical protein
MRSLWITPLLTALALAAGAAGAQDPLKSPACGQALAALEAARAGEDRAATEARRQEAVRMCLGGEPPARSARAIQPPLRVPPPVIEPPRAARPAAPAPAMPAPPVQIGRPAIASHCDAAGCWVNDGSSHLRHVPQPSTGTCTPMGPTLYCP